MNYRLTTLLSQVSATTARTRTIDVNVKDIISRISIKFNYANTNHVPIAHPAAIISKVELVDGSDVLASLSGRQLEALMFYETSKGRLSELDYRLMYLDTTTYFWGYLVLDLYFGRFLYDPELAFDPTKFRNPQLKITYNMVSGGSTPANAQLEVFADVFDEKIVSPVGFLVNKEFYDFSLSDGAYEHIDLPTDLPMRKLLICSLGADKTMEEQVAELKLSEDNDKRIPVNMNTIDYLRMVRQLFGLYQEAIAASTPDIAANWYYVTPVNKFTTLFEVIITKGDLRLQAEAMGGRVNLMSDEITTFRMLVAGYEPHGVFPVTLGDQKDVADWYDVTRLGSLRLRLKAGDSVASDSTCQVVTQQLRRY